MYHKIRWTADKIASRLKLLEEQQLVYRRSVQLPAFRYYRLPDPLTPPPLGPEIDRTNWPTIEPLTYWGERYTDFVLHTTFTVPADWDPALPTVLCLPLGESGEFSHPEALAYVDGEAWAACDRHHQEFWLSPRWCDGESHALDLHGWAGMFGDPVRPERSALLMRPCLLAQVDQQSRDFMVLARNALETATVLDENAPAKGRLLDALDTAFKVLDTREPLGESFYASLPHAHETLRAGIAAAGPGLDVTVLGTGHAHLDTAWLWTLGQARRKAGRSFYSVVRLMEHFPDYHFTQSQPQLYDYVRQDYPELFAAIQARVAEGRWEPIGGMWVEADCNLSGPESLARQFLLGRAFYRRHFGPDAESPILWLPDVFGYAWNLPQLIKEAGLEYFFTIKIGWNQYNRLPYDSFWWQGLDGTKVLTHFSATPDEGGYVSTYNANAAPASNLGTWTNFQQKDLQSTLLMTFGYGDGGGGPTREMLENIAVMADFPGLPHMRNASAIDFYRAMEAEAGDRLPTWNGELYLELHRGTYTTQSRNKRANRKSEFLLHDAEFLATLASLTDPGYAYPQAALHRAWELVCLNQFHDIIPGSSITAVYVESQQQYAEVRALAEEVIDQALAGLAPADAYAVIVNPTNFTRSDLAFVPGDLPADQHLTCLGRVLPLQRTEGGVWVAAGPLAPYSVNSLELAEGPGPGAPPTSLRAAPDCLENDFVRVELDSAGDISRIYDKFNGREVLPPGACANQFQAFEDRPLRWDAWDIDQFLDDKCWLADPAQSIRVAESGPLRAALEIRRRILNSEYVQRIALTFNSPQIDVTTTIDWRDRRILLKVSFPIDVLSPTATYEIQWGNTERPTHRNTSWDWARFETCAQKWVDLSEGDYGVSLLNDCKYGHDIKENVIRLSLLRGPGAPDPTADLGTHTFAYSLLPHAGRWDVGTVGAAYALNDPLVVWQGEGRGPTGDRGSLVVCDAPHVVIETVKRAEDGKGVIVRLYESQRRRGSIRVTAGFPIGAAYRTNLLEENGRSLAVDGRTITYAIRPYEIVTLRLVPA